MAKLAMISLGCAKNQVNSEQMLYLLAEAGHQMVGRPEEAEVAVVNTCGFIESAKTEAIDHILELGELKAAGLLDKIIVAGCLSQRYGQEILREMPEVDGVLGTGSYGEIVSAVDRALHGERPAVFGDIHAPVEETERIITTSASWAYLKIAEGCDNHCAYCVIPDLRGNFHSRPMENILAEARRLAGGGVQELIVVAQDITRYGLDLYGRRRLPELIRALAALEGVRWVRLHYLYPDELDGELIDVIRDEKKVLNYLDIPIQHINDGILGRMNRRGTGDEIRTLFTRLRRELPGLVLRTSLIVGFPGEGEAELDELAAFLEQYQIQRAGVFPYSPEEGTPAAEMADRPSQEEAVRRAERLMTIQDRVMEAFNRDRMGLVEEVLCEGYDPERGMYFGRSYAESPDVDGVIWLEGDALIIGGFYRVRYTGEIEGELAGEVLAPADQEESDDDSQ